jgi:hypothetical protein
MRWIAFWGEKPSSDQLASATESESKAVQALISSAHSPQVEAKLMHPISLMRVMNGVDGENKAEVRP